MKRDALTMPGAPLGIRPQRPWPKPQTNESRLLKRITRRASREKTSLGAFVTFEIPEILHLPGVEGEDFIACIFQQAEIM